MVKKTSTLLAIAVISIVALIISKDILIDKIAILVLIISLTWGALR